MLAIALTQPLRYISQYGHYMRKLKAWGLEHYLQR